MSAFLFTSNRELFCLKVDDFLVENGRQLMEIASEYSGGVPVEELSIIHNGHLISEDSKLQLKAGDVCHANLRLLGGKGGFGSMLRALGAQIEKTTNREACRDLSGRRMRDINDEKKIAEWVSKQADREREKEKQRQERMERKRRMPRHTFDDASYTKHIQDNSERVEDALQQGFKAAGVVASTSSSTTTEKTTVKRVHSDEPTASGGSKKSRMWLGMDDLDSDDNEDTFPASENSSSTVSSFSSTRVEPSTSYDSLDNNYDTDTRVETHPMATTALQGQVNNNEPDKEDKTEGIHGEVAVLQATTKEDGPSMDRSSAEKQDTEKLSHQKIKICLEDYTSAEELKSVGLDQLKEELMARGLKCGGTLQQRAQRLFSTKGVPLNQLDPSLFAKTTGSKKLNGKKN